MGVSNRPISEALIKIANSKVPNDPRGRTFAELLAEGMFLRALGGDVQAAKEIADRIEGRVGRRSVAEDRPAEIKVIWDDPVTRSAPSADARGSLGSSTSNRPLRVAAVS